MTPYDYEFGGMYRAPQQRQRMPQIIGNEMDQVYGEADPSMGNYRMEVQPDNPDFQSASGNKVSVNDRAIPMQAEQYKQQPWGIQNNPEASALFSHDLGITNRQQYPAPQAQPQQSGWGKTDLAPGPEAAQYASQVGSNAARDMARDPSMGNYRMEVPNGWGAPPADSSSVMGMTQGGPSNAELAARTAGRAEQQYRDRMQYASQQQQPQQYSGVRGGGNYAPNPSAGVRGWNRSRWPQQPPQSNFTGVRGGQPQPRPAYPQPQQPGRIYNPQPIPAPRPAFPGSGRQGGGSMQRMY